MSSAACGLSSWRSGPGLEAIVDIVCLFRYHNLKKTEDSPQPRLFLRAGEVCGLEVLVRHLEVDVGALEALAAGLVIRGQLGTILFPVLSVSGVDIIYLTRYYLRTSLTCEGGVRGVAGVTTTE